MATPALSFDQPDLDFVIPMLQKLEEWQPRITLTGNHRYKVDGEYKLGVTTVIKSAGLGSENLIGWAARVQRKADLALLDECQWDQLAFRSKCGEAKAYEQIRDQAADKGTEMHAVFEAECKAMMGQSPKYPEMNDEQKGVLDKFRRWATLNDLRPLGTELRVYSPSLGYCGTLDLIAILRGQLKIVDYKGREDRLRRPYDAHILQSSAYRHATAELTDTNVAQIGGEIVTFPRPGAPLDVESFEVTHDPTEAMEAFRACISLHGWLKVARK